MTDALVCCVVQRGYHIPMPNGEVAEFGQRVLLPASFARKWQARGALQILDDDTEGTDT